MKIKNGAYIDICEYFYFYSNKEIRKKKKSSSTELIARHPRGTYVLALPLLPSGPGGFHAEHIARDPAINSMDEWSINLFGGEGGIRTLGTRKRTHAFQACSLSHSGTSPNSI